LRRIFDHGYSPLRRDATHTDDVGRISVQVRYDNRINTALDCTTHRVKVWTQRSGIYVIEAHVHSCSESGSSEIDAGVSRIGDRSAPRNDLF
jgi:hypothetical protein